MYWCAMAGGSVAGRLRRRHWGTAKCLWGSAAPSPLREGPDAAEITVVAQATGRCDDCNGVRRHASNPSSQVPCRCGLPCLGELARLLNLHASVGTEPGSVGGRLQEATLGAA